MSARCGAGCCATNSTWPPSSTREVDRLVEVRGEALQRGLEHRAQVAAADHRQAQQAGAELAPAAWPRRCARSRPARAPRRCGAPSSWAGPSAPRAARGCGRRLGSASAPRIAAARVITCIPPSGALVVSVRRLGMCPLSVTPSPSSPRLDLHETRVGRQGVRLADHHAARREQVHAAAPVGGAPRLADGIVDGRRLVGVHRTGRDALRELGGADDGAAVVEDAGPGRAARCRARPRPRG